MIFIYAWLLPSLPFKSRVAEKLKKLKRTEDENDDVDNQEDIDNASDDETSKSSNSDVLDLNKVELHDHFKNGFKMTSSINIFLSHFKPTHKVLAAYIFVTWYIDMRFYFFHFYEFVGLGSVSGSMTTTCTCDFEDGEEPLLPLALEK